jgi:small subunit ribosomal protein S1
MQKQTRRRVAPETMERIQPVVPAGAAAPRERLDLSGLEDIANMDPSELARLLDAQPAQFELGDAVEGTITRVGKDAVFVDIGAKSEAILERSEAVDPTLGARVAAYVIATGEDGIRISKKISGRAASALLASAHENGMPVEGKVVGANKGGFDIRIGDARAFCPISHMDRARIEEPQLWIGKTLTFQVIEVGDKVVVSRRALIQKEAESAQEAFWATAKEGDEHHGKVSSVQKFGVFVDIGGVDGLVPVRELGWGDVDPAKLAPGQELEVRVIGIDREKRKLTLSARDPSDSPWTRVGSDFAVGGVYKGTVKTVTEFGAFVEIAPGLQGLLHRSRLPRQSTIPKPGTEMEVRLDAIDTDKKRLSLAHPDVEPERNVRQEEGWEGAPDSGRGGSLGTFADLMKGVKTLR